MTAWFHLGASDPRSCMLAHCHDLLEQVNRSEPSSVLTPVLFLLWPIKTSAVRKAHSMSGICHRTSETDQVNNPRWPPELKVVHCLAAHKQTPTCSLWQRNWLKRHWDASHRWSNVRKSFYQWELLKWLKRLRSHLVIPLQNQDRF